MPDQVKAPVGTFKIWAWGQAWRGNYGDILARLQLKLVSKRARIGDKSG